MLRYPITWGHGPLTLNSHLDATGLPVEGNMADTIVLTEARLGTLFRSTAEPLHLAQGGTLGRVHKGMKRLAIAGKIEVPDTTQEASLSDRERALRVAFDPFQCTLDSPSTDGAFAWDFTEDTIDTVTYAGGRIPLRYFARPIDHPYLLEKQVDRGTREFSLDLLIPDPRMYEQVEQTISLTPGSPSQNVVNRGNTPGPLKATITMAGAGSASFTITLGGKAFVLSLTGLSNGNVVTVIFETSGPYGIGRSVKVGAADAFSRKTSAADTWLVAPVGTNLATITNTTNITSCVLAWYSARV